MFSHIKELFTRPSGYQISRSVRLRSSASAYLNKTLVTATDGKKWTYSIWLKRGLLNNNSEMLMAYTGANNRTFLAFSGDIIQFYQYTSGTYPILLATNAVYRDPSAWYHVVLTYDSTQATSSNRCLLYVNGVQVTSFSTATYPSLNYINDINTATPHAIGRDIYNNTSNFDGQFTEINFIDGQALTPSSFGETNAVTGVWQPKKYAGTYGTNGFYLNFSDNSAATAATIGKDYSGNGNNWTPNNISVTAGVTYDSMIDVPTMWADGGDGRGNYCTISPFQMAVSGPLFSLSSGNLNYSCSASTGNAGRMYARGTMALHSGKTYWEVKATSTNAGVGICDISQMTDAGGGSLKSLVVYNTTQSATNTSATYTGTTFTFAANDMIGFAFDGTAMTLACYKNNTLIGTWSGIDSTVTWLPLFAINASASSTSMEANFGQRPFTYTPPTGFVALNTQNLTAPTISNGAQYMAASLFTGTSGNVTVSNAVNGISFQPDFLWVKARSNAQGHSNVDSVRGASKLLQTNLTNAESTLTNPPTFNADGFTSTTDIHTNGYTYVGWSWKAGGTAVSNTVGTITSSVSVNQTAGFSVVTWTGTGSNATVGHGLGVAPSLIINKPRNAADNWISWHTSLGATGYIYLNLTNASATGATVWNSTLPTSSVFSVGTSSNVNTSGQTMVSYCWAAVAGYSAFGSYTGNGSADGPFVYLGFRPRWIMVKRTDAANDWVIMDTSRDTYNYAQNILWADLSTAETAGGTTTSIDVLSNGFKPRGVGSSINTSAGTYIYVAFAENPFRNSLAR